MPRVEEIAAPRLAQAIERDACILAEQMEQAYRDEIPEYRRKSAEFEAESRAVSEAAIGSAVLLLRGEVSEHELLGTDLWAGLGRRRAQQGFPLHAVVQSFQTGTRVMFARLHHEADLIGPDASLVLA